MDKPTSNEDSPAQEKRAFVKNNWAWFEHGANIEFSEHEDGGGWLTFGRTKYQVMLPGKAPEKPHQAEGWKYLTLPGPGEKDRYPYLWLDEKAQVAYRMDRSYSRIIGP